MLTSVSVLDQSVGYGKPIALPEEANSPREGVSRLLGRRENATHTGKQAKILSYLALVLTCLSLDGAGSFAILPALLLSESSTFGLLLLRSRRGEGSGGGANMDAFATKGTRCSQGKMGRHHARGGTEVGRAASEEVEYPRPATDTQSDLPLAVLTRGSKHVISRISPFKLSATASDACRTLRSATSTKSVRTRRFTSDHICPHGRGCWAYAP